ncbi:hypothetical protein DN069_12380 [Streptacidiphilus pinicola]|uniref:Uncharacterized protein n=1 Tax=Streptacidiphilus pinicola TaxID=2219663 RepID=A0A2X0IL25_9ACTN|nr:hypothetical protein [Streptacidiphilus pinicola]RAG85327.1 hypothetical protein DN069_12380 [Streptacidiphilus pinicola]
MSHACAPLLARPARLTNTVTAPARPLLVVERLDHSVDAAVLLSFCVGPGSAAPAPALGLAPAGDRSAAWGGVDAGAWV